VLEIDKMVSGMILAKGMQAEYENRVKFL